jgi:hypothetical protein
MHFNFDFSAPQILWTLTFASLLVLLVVLLGRDRMRRFPWFTASIAMMGLLLLATELMLPKFPRLTGTMIFLGLSDLDVLIVLMMLIELARGAFRGMGQLGWTTGTLALLAVAAAVLAFWGPWPAWSTMFARSELATIRLMDMAVDKGTLFTAVLTIALGVLVTLFGRRYSGGWHTHVQQIMIGLSTATMAQLTLRGILQAIGTHSHIHSQADFDRVMGLRDKLIHANNVLYICVMLWWIACLWADEPGSGAEASGAESIARAGRDAASGEATDTVENAESKVESDGPGAQADN